MEPTRNSSILTIWGPARTFSRYSIFFHQNLTTEDFLCFQVLNWSCSPVGNGIDWAINEECDQYTLTREQLEQKLEKRARTRIYSVIKKASGSWVPIMHGCQVLIHPPLTDEPRIKLSPGDIVKVTRWRKYWLFGEKIDKKSDDDTKPKRVRGWFPRPCAVELADESEEQQQYFNDKKIK